MKKVDVFIINRRIHKYTHGHSSLIVVAMFFYVICFAIDRNFYKELTKQALWCQGDCKNNSTISIILKMLWVFASENFTPYEFRCYAFLSKSKNERQKYIPEESLKWTFKTDKSINKLPRNKFRRYQLFSSLFHRDIICLSQENTEQAEKDYCNFKKNHSEAIFKPLKGAQGKGVRKISIKGMDYQSLREILGTGDYMVEEVIKQGLELARFHPSSINTIRYVTAMSPEGKYSVLYSMLRCGGSGSVVDNVGSGGYIMLISDDGVIETDAMRAGEYFEKHPDTDVIFKGSKIPSWQEIKDIAEKAHKSLPEQRLFGWDFAWTENGWDLVEVNPGPAVVSFQILKNKGLKPNFQEAGILLNNS